MTLAVLGVLLLASVAGYRAIHGQANSTVAATSLSRVAAAQASMHREWGRYTPYGADLSLAGADVTAVDNVASSSPSQVSIAAGTKGGVGLAAADGRGTCVLAYLPPPTDTDSDLVSLGASSPAVCNGAAALSAAGGPSDTPIPAVTGGTTIRGDDY